jgi:hypothetical protein
MNPAGGGLMRQTKTSAMPVVHLLFRLRGRGVRLPPISTTPDQTPSGLAFSFGWADDKIDDINARQNSSDSYTSSGRRMCYHDDKPLSS